jgi:hypothetical protein
MSVNLPAWLAFKANMGSTNPEIGRSRVEIGSSPHVAQHVEAPAYSAVAWVKGIAKAAGVNTQSNACGFGWQKLAVNYILWIRWVPG